MGALDGIKVRDLSILIQGPQAAAMLADLGAGECYTGRSIYRSL